MSPAINPCAVLVVIVIAVPLVVLVVSVELVNVVNTPALLSTKGVISKSCPSKYIVKIYLYQ